MLHGTGSEITHCNPERSDHHEGRNKAGISGIPNTPHPHEVVWQHVEVEPLGCFVVRWHSISYSSRMYVRSLGNSV